MNRFWAMFHHPRAGIVLLRTTLAILTLLHGWAKVQNGIGGIVGMVERMGLPGFVAYGVYLGEVVAPILLLVGVWVVPAALVVAINMVVAVLLAHQGQWLDITKTGGWALELQAFFFVSALTVAMTSSRGKG